MEITIEIIGEFYVLEGRAMGHLSVALPKDEDGDLLTELRNADMKIAGIPLTVKWGQYDTQDFKFACADIPITASDDIRTPVQLEMWIEKEVTYIQSVISAVLKARRDLNEACLAASERKFKITFREETLG